LAAFGLRPDAIVRAATASARGVVLVRMVSYIRSARDGATAPRHPLAHIMLTEGFHVT
jgi:hypothetical protein